jgi:hypothetical protein
MNAYPLIKEYSVEIAMGAAFEFIEAAILVGHS